MFTQASLIILMTGRADRIWRDSKSVSAPGWHKREVCEQKEGVRWDQSSQAEVRLSGTGNMVW